MAKPVGFSLLVIGEGALDDDDNPASIFCKKVDGGEAMVPSSRVVTSFSTRHHQACAVGGLSGLLQGHNGALYEEGGAPGETRIIGREHLSDDAGNCDIVVLAFHSSAQWEDDDDLVSLMDSVMDREPSVVVSLACTQFSPRWGSAVW